MTRLLAIAALVVGVFIVHGINDPTVHHQMGGADVHQQSGHHEPGETGRPHPLGGAGLTCAALCAVAVLFVTSHTTRVDRSVRTVATAPHRSHRSLLSGPEPPVPRFA